MGGAFVVLPMLGGPFSLPIHKAIGTSMGAVMGTCVGGALSFSMKRNDNESSSDLKISPPVDDKVSYYGIPLVVGDVNVLASGFIIASAAVFAVVGARCSKLVRDRTIKIAQGIFMMSVAPSIMIRDYLKAQSPAGESATVSQTKEQSIEDILSPSYVLRLMSIGVGSGFLAGFFGVGGGAVTVPCLVMLMDFDYKTALGTSMAGSGKI